MPLQKDSPFGVARALREVREQKTGIRMYSMLTWVDWSCCEQLLFVVTGLVRRQPNRLSEPLP